MFWWSAFILGFIGSIHCGVMCGPIVMAIQKRNINNFRFILHQIAYNSGRVMTYLFIGAFVGLIGKGLWLAGAQQTVSILAGVILLCLYFIPKYFRRSWLLSGSSLIRFTSAPGKLIGKYLTGRTITAKFMTGLANGLLPCGLVYVAAAGAVATGEPYYGVIYMALFGLGTVPILFVMAFSSQQLRVTSFKKVNRLIPVFVFCLSLLFILRGMDLGIKYLSPDLTHKSSPTEITDCVDNQE